ncbi:hypothetical protein U9M48_034921 [Paspalum notatum var. saurae]|uniref:Uncharacterized protein n=1 Tax=Paspalum notatum var. saurae TaxID=547442 RepID=A0AAQ3U9Z7_PASNO
MSDKNCTVPRAARRREPQAAEARRSTSVDGIIYVPPYRTTAEDDDGCSDESGGNAAGYQRRSWDALRKSITGLVNKVNPANARHVAWELLAENLVRGRGLLCRALLRSQAACPRLTDVFAALAAAVKARLPRVGRLPLARLVLRARRAHAAGDTRRLAAAATFVAHDLLALELLDRPTDGSVEVAGPRRRRRRQDPIF